MKSGFTLALLTAFSAPGLASSATTVYTDRTAFEAALGSFTTFTFDDSVATTSALTDFGEFTFDAVSSTSTDQTEYRVSGGELVIDESFGGADYGGSSPEWLLNFDTPISALGFDYRNTDSSSDFFEIIVDSVGYATAGPLSTGFLGILSTDSFSMIGFQDTVGDGGNLEVSYIDNLTYSALAPVPLPAGVVLMLTGLGALAGAGWRRRRSV